MTLSSSRCPEPVVAAGGHIEFTGLRPQALGLFDSGLGGLTVLRRLLSQRPGQPCLWAIRPVFPCSRERAEIRSTAEVVGWLRARR